MHALGRADLKEGTHLLEDQVEWARLVSGGRSDGVAVHRIARPHYDASLLLHGADERRQELGSLVGADTADQRQSARLVLRIEDIDQAQELIGLLRGAGLQTQRILDAA